MPTSGKKVLVCRNFYSRCQAEIGKPDEAPCGIESALPSLAQLPGAAEEELHAGLADLRSVPSQPGAGLGWVVHESTAVR